MFVDRHNYEEDNGKTADPHTIHFFYYFTTANGCEQLSFVVVFPIRRGRERSVRPADVSCRD